MDTFPSLSDVWGFEIPPGTEGQDIGIEEDSCFLLLGATLTADAPPGFRTTLSILQQNEDDTQTSKPIVIAVLSTDHSENVRFDMPLLPPAKLINTPNSTSAALKGNLSIHVFGRKIENDQDELALDPQLKEQLQNIAAVHQKDRVKQLNGGQDEEDGSSEEENDEEEEEGAEMDESDSEIEEEEDLEQLLKGKPKSGETLKTGKNVPTNKASNDKTKIKAATKKEPQMEVDSESDDSDEEMEELVKGAALKRNTISPTKKVIEKRKAPNSVEKEGANKVNEKKLKRDIGTDAETGDLSKKVEEAIKGWVQAEKGEITVQAIGTKVSREFGKGFKQLKLKHAKLTDFVANSQTLKLVGEKIVLK